MATVLSDTCVLSDELLQTFGERAPTYDRENRFFAEDFEDLRLAGYHCVEGAKRIVDLAMEVSGGTGMFKSSELERLYRDVRCGGFHPANSALVHELVGKTTLGILGEEPRW